MIYLHWPQDISLHALRALEVLITDRLHEGGWVDARINVEMQNIANEARAMIQKASIGAIKVERRPAPVEDDELLG